eukprot:TRINITY_DN345_c0_g1_i1.p1 TRINITY_DN345_c0_g1~~TRINITY_DN345_c0_g1_i1.p1  ORF type:complete len:357 (-),score=-15.01 TRINITY_DN345_c0_g1_i1:249-1319(-)
MLAQHVGRILGPPPQGSAVWDAKCFSGAVVLVDNTNNSMRYRMYYYGRQDEWWNSALGIKAPKSLPSGRVGVAMSPDGVNFTRHCGPLPGGAVFGPSNDPHAFDSLHVACSDAVHVPSEDTWLLYYLGGGISSPMTLLPGVASSPDGFHFCEKARRGPLLTTGTHGSWDERGVTWPRVFTGPAGELFMTYHAVEPAGHISAGIAVSTDSGASWTKLGKILTRGEKGAWDENGVSVRHVIRRGDEYVMLYEGSKGDRDAGFEFAIGLATSKDGVRWQKDEGAGEEPGGPVLRARKGMDVWDNFIVGTPYVLLMEDGSLRMYYLGIGKKSAEDEPVYGIGLALTHGCDYRRWRRYGES